MSCTQSNQKKYTERPSPPFPANRCPVGDIKTGNDHRSYIAKPDKNGVKHWVVLNNNAPKTQKNKVRSSESSKTKSIPTLSQVIASLPALTKKKIKEARSSSETQDEFIKKIYGQHAKPLTVKRAKQLPLNQKICFLEGQEYDMIEDIGDNESGIQVHEITKKTYDHEGLQLQIDGDWYMYEYKGKMVTGSGADPVYVFV